MSENPLALKPNTIIRGRYLVGEVLGQGGFAITYAGHDLALDIKVAIKEYFPMGVASRSQAVSNQILWNTTQVTPEAWQEGCDGFLKEARRMAKIDFLPGIVRVRDTFPENQTAYIVMDYIEGKNLKEYLRENGTMSVAQCLELFMPLMESLEKIHKKELIHRDISPDNIMLQPDGTLCLLDFGAAKDVSLQKNAASKQVAKKGFSPPEQYMDSGIIGPWTDVYALCATMYYCITGKLVPDAMERVWNDTLSFPEDLSIGACLKRGLELRMENRITSVAELLAGLGEPVVKKETKPEVTEDVVTEEVKVEPEETIQVVYKEPTVEVNNPFKVAEKAKMSVCKSFWFVPTVTLVLFFIATILYDRGNFGLILWDEAIAVNCIILFLALFLAVLVTLPKLSKYKNWILGLVGVLQLIPIFVCIYELGFNYYIHGVGHFFWAVCSALILVCCIWTFTQVLKAYSKLAKITWIPAGIVGAYLLFNWISALFGVSYFFSWGFVFDLVLLVGIVPIIFNNFSGKNKNSFTALKQLEEKKICLLSIAMYIAVFVVAFIASDLQVDKGHDCLHAYSEGSWFVLFGLIISIILLIISNLLKFEKSKNAVIASSAILVLIPLIWIMDVNRYGYGNSSNDTIWFVLLCVVIALASLANGMMLFDRIGLKWATMTINIIFGCIIGLSSLGVIVYLVRYLQGRVIGAYVFWLLLEAGLILFAYFRRKYRRRIRL